MSLAQRKPLSISVVSDHSDTMEINQLYHSNSSNTIVADMLHRGLLSGDFKLSDQDFRSTILALTKNIIMVNEDIHNAKRPSCPCPHNSPCNTFVGDKDINSDSSSLTNSVHILDVTDVNSDKAQELLSCHQVSRIGEGVEDVKFIENPITSMKKRSLSIDAMDNDKQNQKKKSILMFDSLPISILTTIDEVFSYLSHSNINVSPVLNTYKNSGELPKIGRNVYH
jgi:hypothetical protein